jgi:hypothetical protein
MNNKPELEIDSRGNKYWKLNGLCHQEDGPAIESANGTKCWCLYGKFNRVDGPAIIFADGGKIWSLNDIPYSSHDEWFKRLTPEQQYNYLWNLDE